jgi:hypothetical protein
MGLYPKTNIKNKGAARLNIVDSKIRTLFVFINTKSRGWPNQKERATSSFAKSFGG